MLRRILALALTVLAIIGLCGCAHTSAAPRVPFIPPAYYNCIEVSADDLLKAYFHVNYGNVAMAEQAYHGLYFLFRGVLVNDTMLKDKGKDVLYLSTIRCLPLQSGAVAALKAGQIIDIVGINSGPALDWPGWLVMTGCVFLPSGSVQLPAPGGGVFVPTY